MYFCTIDFSTMENEQKTDNQPQSNNRRKALFWVGISLGILLGAVLTMLIVNWLDHRRPNEIQIINPTQNPSKSDTVVKYVIHKHESYLTQGGDLSISDTSKIDSIYQEEISQDYMLDDEDVLALEREEEESAVPTEHMISKSFVKVIFWDNDKNMTSAPENAILNIQLQQWDTPIKNKLSYRFAGNTLQVKGIAASQCRVIHYKGTYYLVTAKHSYPIHHITQICKTSIFIISRK